MKKMFKFSMAVAAIAAITSCSNEEIIPGEGSVTSNEKATLSVTIAGGGQTTRAIDDSNATNDELKASNATIFVFNAQNAHEADTTVVLSNHDDGTNKYKVTFEVPIGNNKLVYVGLNFTPAMTNWVKTNGLAAMTYAINAQEGLFYGTGSSFGGNPMFNEAPVYTNIVQGQNSANVKVERLTSKITVIKEGLLATSDVKASNATFSNSDIKFAMGNKNTKILPMKEQIQWIDPNWDGNTSYFTDFQNEFQVLGKAWNQWDISKFVTVDDASTANNLRKTKYAFENTHKTAQQGEVTYAAIMVKFTPDTIAASFDNQSKTPVLIPTPGNNMDSLHVVIDNNSYYYYNNVVEADKHVAYLNSILAAQGATNQVSYTTYYNQSCFYQVWLNSNTQTKEYQAKRNEYYSVGLSDIKKLGSPYPEIEPGTGTVIIGATSSITVNITVNPWTLINMGGTVLGN